MSRTDRRAALKRAAKKFRVGDLVTWGNCAVSHPVVAVTRTGVVVDTSHRLAADGTVISDASHNFGIQQPDGRYFLHVPFNRHAKDMCGNGFRAVWVVKRPT